MIFYCVSADQQNAWTTRKDEALRMARTLTSAAKETRVVKVSVQGKEQVAELLNVASGVVEMHTGGEVIYRFKQPEKSATKRTEQSLPT